MAKGAFGGKQISFKGQTATMEEVFGPKDLTPPEMSKKLWEYVKKHGLSE